jgi:hypothetical protein
MTRLEESGACSPTTTTQDLSFLERSKRSLTGSSCTPLVLLGNFEVEDAWATGEVGLPSVGGASATAALVHRMDELTLLLAGPQDHVVLKSEPDSDHLDYLGALGIDLPTLHVVESNDPFRTVTLDALASPSLLADLGDLAQSGARLLTHGMSPAEEKLSAITGLRSLTANSDVAKAVNGPGYSRELCDELQIEQAQGWECRTVADFERACREASKLVGNGSTIGVKDAFGVSGKGIVTVNDPRRLDQLVRMVSKRATRTGDDRLAVVVEVWADKAKDFNYHFTVGSDGEVTFDFVKQAITEGGVHKGHWIPSSLHPGQIDDLKKFSHSIGTRLAKDGFFGFVGVDALLEKNGRLLPVLEINARSNMSTYTVPLQEKFLPDGWMALARQYSLTLTKAMSFVVLRDALHDLLLSHAGRAGLIVQGTGTINAGVLSAPAGGAFVGRLHGLLVARNEDELNALDRAVSSRLNNISTRGDMR